MKVIRLDTVLMVALKIVRRIHMPSAVKSGRIGKKDTVGDGQTLPAMSDRLSKREAEVFDLMGEFLGPKDIGARLYLSTKTVQSHMENIKSKLGVKNSWELYFRAGCARMGLSVAN